MSVKIGLWGGNGGQIRETNYTSSRLVSVSVCGKDAIHSIRLTYEDDKDNLHLDALWGGHSGHPYAAVFLDELEYLKEVSGTFGPWSSDPQLKVVTSLKFVTSGGNEHKFGCAGSGDSFRVPVYHGKITGFFVRAGDLIDAIGVCVLPFP